LHIGKLCPPSEGGIEIFTADLLEYLNKNNVKADLLCFDNVSGIKKWNNFSCYACKLNLELNSAPFSFDYIKNFIKIAKNYDIIHVHSPNPLAETLSLFINKPIIVHWHSDIIRQKISYIFYKPIQQRFLKKAKKIIVTSSQYLEASQQLKDHKDKAIVIPSGLKKERLFKENDSKEFEKIKEKIKGKKVVLSIGRLVDYKGFEYLIEAAKFLDEEFLVIIIGNGPLYNKLREKIEKEKVNGKVMLLGKIENINPFLASCDVFCLPSIDRREAFGLVLVEALAFGKPLITTNVYGSGMNYVNVNNETGLVVESKNAKAIAEAIKKITSDKQLYEKFSKNALERFKEFEIEKIGEKIIEVYKEIYEEP
jgi:glycosyltransferase involved in cell wall biosynthesis